MKIGRRISSFSWVILSFVLLVGYNNCSPKKEDSSSSSSSSTLSSTSSLGSDVCENQLIDFFERGYHPFLTKNCAVCHANGPGKGQFANPDLSIAYKDFMQVGYSKVSNNAISDGHNPPYSGSQHTQTINDLRVTWVQALSEYDKCTGGTGSIDSNLTPKDRSHFSLIPKTVPTLNDNETGRMEFDLSTELTSLDGQPIPNLTGAKFSILVHKVLKGTERYYSVHSPRIYNAPSDLHIKGLFTKINTRYIQYSTNFRYIDSSVPKSAVETATASLLSTGAIVIAGTPSPADQISFDFEKIESTVIPPPPPPVVIGFKNSSAIKVDGSGSLNLEVTLNKPSTELVSFTITIDNSAICGANSPTAAVLGASCMPDVYALACPNGNCSTSNSFGDPIASNKILRARSVTGATYNTFDWDYKLASQGAVFAAGETSKTITIRTAKDIRFETNRLLTVNIEKGLGNANVSATQGSVNIYYDKQKNKAPLSDDITYTQLMRPGGILYTNCLNCHNSKPTEQQGGYDITDYETMVSDQKRILVPGGDQISFDNVGNIIRNPASEMYRRLLPEFTSTARRMPRDKYLDYNSGLQDIEKWLLSGAKNN